MKHHDRWSTKPTRGPAAGGWGRTAIAGVLACALALGTGTSLVLGGATVALAEESDLFVTTVGSSSTTTDLADGGTYDLTNYRGDSKAHVLRIKNAGTYHFVQSGRDNITNVQIKVDASSSSKVIIWLDGVTIDNSNHNLSAVNIEGDSSVEIHSTNGSQSTLIGGAQDKDSNDGGAGVYVNDDASVMFASDANIVARGGCFWINGEQQSLRAAGIGGAGSGNSDSGTIVFEEGCTIEAYGATGEKGGAGIGSGYDGVSGKIVIYGGTITAVGGPKAAGIGSASADGTGNGGNVGADIDIMSGTVTATGGASAAGIGTGKDGDLDAGIYLSGGDITATAGSDAAAVGAGANGTIKGKGGISITGGTVRTSGGSVGMGFGASGSADKGSFLKISGGTVYTDSVSKDSDFHITIVGGQVPTNLGDSISNESGQNVYWMKVPVEDPNAVVDSISSNSDFSARDVQPGEDGYVYVYLPASNGQNADENRVTVVQNGKTYEYHDKHTETGDANKPGYLRMDLPDVGIHSTKDPISLGDSCLIYLDDSSPLFVPDGTTWPSDGSSWKFTTSKNVDNWYYDSQSPGAGRSITVHTDTSGTYSVTAELVTDSKGYWANSSSVTFVGTILTKPNIQIADLTKTYDGVAITPDTAKSQVTTNSDGELTVALQRQVDGNWTDVASAIEGGHYRVTATTADTHTYSWWSETKEFDILPVATATSVSAVRNVEDSIVTGWTLTAQVGGFLPGDGQGTVTFTNTTSGRSTVLGATQVDADGKASIFISNDGVNTGAYEVTATYEGTSSYVSSEATLKGFSDLEVRAVTGNTTQKVVYEKGKTFSLGMATDSPAGATDAWTYEVVSDSYSGFAKADGTAAGATVTVDENGTVTVNHAGTAMIKVTLADGAANKTYQDAVAYVTVTVDKAKLVVAPYAADKDGTLVTSATYGSLDGLTTGLLYSYDGGNSWTSDAPDWDYGFAGSLAAGAINTAAQVGTLDVPVTQTSGSFSVDGTAHEGFFSRDYDISYSTAYRLGVTKRPLVVTLNDAWGVYGGTAPSIGWSYDESKQPKNGGLVSFDTADRVFQEKPVLAIDSTVTGTADFASIPVRYSDNGDVAAYEGAVSAQGGVSANYDVDFVKGNFTIYPETLSDTGRIVVTGGSDYTYDGAAHEPSGYVVSDAGNELLADKDYELSVDGDTTNAGTVTVTFMGKGNYSGTVTATYAIAPAELMVKTPSASKTYDGTALTANSGATLEGLVAGEIATAKATGSLTDADVADNTYEIAWGTAKESNYKVHQDLGTLEVKPRTLTVATYSAKKQYDGEPLTAGGSMQGLVKGETATLQMTGSQTEVGSSDNTFEIAWGSAKASNYDVDPYLGTLTVEPNTAAITLTAPSCTKRYDSRPLAAIGYKVSGLPKGFFVRAEVAGSQTDVGSSESSIASYAIIDSAGNDVTSYFPNVTKVAGILKVTERDDAATDQNSTTDQTAADTTGNGTSGNSSTTGDGTSGAADTSDKASAGRSSGTSNSNGPTSSSKATIAVEASAAQASSLPKTGDVAATGTAMAVLAVGAAALAMAYLLRRRRS